MSYRNHFVNRLFHFVNRLFLSQRPARAASRAKFSESEQAQLRLVETLQKALISTNSSYQPILYSVAPDTSIEKLFPLFMTAFPLLPFTVFSSY